MSNARLEEISDSLPSAFCLLSSAFCLLSSAFCLLPSALCLLFSLVRVLDEEHLVARLVVEQLIHDLTHEQEAKAAGTQALCFSHAHVAVGLAGRVADGRVLQRLRVEARAGVSDAIEEHAAPAQISDPHLAVRVELPAPLDGVGEQLVEGQSHRLAN